MNTDIKQIRGIGAATVVLLNKHKFKTLSDLANADAARLSAVPGFSQARSELTIKQAKLLLNNSPEPAANEFSAQTTIDKPKIEMQNKNKDKNKKKKSTKDKDVKKNKKDKKKHKNRDKDKKKDKKKEKKKDKDKKKTK